MAARHIVPWQYARNYTGCDAFWMWSFCGRQAVLLQPIYVRHFASQRPIAKCVTGLAERTIKTRENPSGNPEL
jgi:hypothetical protein